MSPLFELSDTALSVVLVIGAITALFMGFLGIIQNDIKRVVAYSTLSQLGYMTVALGASAYSVAVFHLMTHAFFKALLFLAAGSVIIGMHHDQDIRRMGGLRKYMPITWITSLIGSLALIGTPFFSGFYSKDSIIEAVHASSIAGSGFAYFAVVAGVFVTAFYSFRMYFLVFHGKERFHEAAHHDEHGHAEHGHGHTPHETPWVVWLPLVLLMIPSAAIGYFTVAPIIDGNWFGSAIVVNDAAHPAMKELSEHFHDAWGMATHAFGTLVFWLAVAGVAAAYLLYMVFTDVPAKIAARFSLIYKILENKYGFDQFNDWFFAGGARKIGTGLWKGGDVTVIDGWLVNGTARLVGWFSGVIRHFQSGYIYHYAFAMLIGVFVLITWFVKV
jgi:NADH-quinone oxidoreductase subunit L